jgi:hypothetical protein
VPYADRPPYFGGLAVGGGNCGDYALFPQPPGLLALLPNDIANSRLGGFTLHANAQDGGDRNQFSRRYLSPETFTLALGRRY